MQQLQALLWQQALSSTKNVNLNAFRQNKVQILLWNCSNKWVISTSSVITPNLNLGTTAWHQCIQVAELLIPHPWRAMMRQKWAKPTCKRDMHSFRHRHTQKQKASLPLPLLSKFVLFLCHLIWAQYNKYISIFWRVVQLSRCQTNSIPGITQAKLSRRSALNFVSWEDNRIKQLPT